MEKYKNLFRKGLAIFTLFSIELILSWAIFLGSFILFFIVTGNVIYSKQEEFDKEVFSFLNKHITEPRTDFMEAITFLASRNFITGLAIVILLYFLFVKKHHWYSLKIPVVALGSISLNLVLKSLFNRQRPLLPHLVESSGLSFPSGHAMISISFYGLLIYLVWIEVKNKVVRSFLILFLLLIIYLIGFSRIYLRVHYASDVIAGFAVGTIWLITSLFIVTRLENFSKRKITPVLEEED